MNKILVLGATGLIGHQAYNFLKTNTSFDMQSLAYRTKLVDSTVLCNARDENRLLDIIRDFNPDFIVNAMGILIGGANKDPKNAIFLNAYMPHRLMALGDEIGAKLIHISTDCVFSGRKGQYTENDEKDGLDTYAKAKGLGEIINDRHITLRTSVVGPELKLDGEELFHWFMSQSGTIKGFTKAMWSGVTTLELAKAIQWAIQENITGLYHVTNGTPISKYDLLNIFKKHTQKDIEILPYDGKILDKSFIDTREERATLIPSYDIMVRDMVAVMKKNPLLYKHYSL